MLASFILVIVLGQKYFTLLTVRRFSVAKSRHIPFATGETINTHT